MKKLLTIILSLTLLLSTISTTYADTITKQEYTTELFTFITLFHDHNDNAVYMYLQSNKDSSGYIVETNLNESDIDTLNIILKDNNYILILDQHDQVIEMYLYKP